MIGILKRSATVSLFAVAAVLTAGCGDTTVSPMEPDASPASLAAAQSGAAMAGQSADRCERVLVEGSAPLGFVQLASGEAGLGALPTTVTIAGRTGTLRSVVTGMNPSGSLAQGALHLTLVHLFESGADSFRTSDVAVCAPAGPDAGTCRVNDVLSVVSGTGAFANAGGSLRNHGVINFNTGTLTISLRGRVCGDGV
ncbi:MAG: hypothetical protein V4617_17560 [Gemmatimonadota bacterium]